MDVRLRELILESQQNLKMALRYMYGAIVLLVLGILGMVVGLSLLLYGSLIGWT